MDFSLIKHIHLTTIVISLLLFSLRFYGVMQHVNAITQARWLRFVPHIVDTILLVSAITLAVKLGLKPGETPWILAKLIALVAYIVAGSFALKRAKTQRGKLISGIIALTIFAYIVSVAFSKSVLGIFA